jgi:SUMO ligase MMS21 Smc5/6 complex component
MCAISAFDKLILVLETQGQFINAEYEHIAQLVRKVNGAFAKSSTVMCIGTCLVHRDAIDKLYENFSDQNDRVFDEFFERVQWHKYYTHRKSISVSSDVWSNVSHA